MNMSLTSSNRSNKMIKKELLKVIDNGLLEKLFGLWLSHHLPEERERQFTKVYELGDYV